MHVSRRPSLLGLGLLLAASALAPSAPPPLAEVRADRLRAYKAELRRYGVADAEADAEAQRADAAATELGGSEADWAWAFHEVTQDTLRRLRLQEDAQRADAVAAYRRVRGHSHQHALADELPRAGNEVTVALRQLPDPSRATVDEIAAAADPPGFVDGEEVPPHGQATPWGGREAAVTSPGRATNMAEVNRQRRAAGLLGTRRQRQRRAAKGLKP